jgi:type II secretory pathway predicted ATPase ExeA
MYERHFGLTRAPFRITPDPEFFFPGGNRGAVLEALTYAIARGEGVVKVVGEVGSGKTMLCRMLERELPPNCDVVYLANPALDPDAVLNAIAFEMGLGDGAGANKLAVLHRIQDHLLAKHAENRRVVMFVEEAQALPLASLEELRLLSNLETTTEKLLQIVLFGQPELDAKLAAHDIRQLRERITHSFELTGLAGREMRDYVNARLRASGYRGGELFTRGALKQIERASAGLLRRINVLADKALLAAFATNSIQVSAAHVRRAIKDSEFGRRGSPFQARYAWVAAGLLCAGALGWWLSTSQEFFPRWSFLRELSRADVSSTPALAHDPVQRETRSEVAAAPTPVAEAPQPEVSPVTGLVGIAHLRPIAVEADAREVGATPD